eukprot:177539_1
MKAFTSLLNLYLWISVIQSCDITRSLTPESILFFNHSDVKISTKRYPAALNVSSKLNGKFVRFQNITISLRNNSQYVISSLHSPSLQIKVKKKHLSLRPVITVHVGDVTHLKPNTFGPQWMDSVQNNSLEMLMAKDIVNQYHSTAFVESRALHVRVPNVDSLNFSALNYHIDTLLEALRIGIAFSTVIHLQPSPSYYPSISSTPTKQPSEPPSTKKRKKKKRKKKQKHVHIHYVTGQDFCYENHQLWWDNSTMNDYFMIFGQRQRLYMQLAQHIGKNMIYSALSECLFHANINPQYFLDTDPKWMDAVFARLHLAFNHSAESNKNIGIKKDIQQAQNAVQHVWELTIQQYQVHHGEYIENPYDYFVKKRGNVVEAISQLYGYYKTVALRMVELMIAAMGAEVRSYFGSFDAIGNFSQMIVNEILTQLAKLEAGNHLHVVFYPAVNWIDSTVVGSIIRAVYEQCNRLNYGISTHFYQNILEHMGSLDNRLYQTHEQINLMNLTIFYMNESRTVEDFALCNKIIGLPSKKVMLFGAPPDYYIEVASAIKKQLVDSKLSHYLLASIKLCDASKLYERGDLHQALSTLLSISDSLGLNVSGNMLERAHYDVKLESLQHATVSKIFEIRQNIGDYCSSISASFEWESAIADEIISQYNSLNASNTLAVIIYNSDKVSRDILEQQLQNLLTGG